MYKMLVKNRKSPWTITIYLVVCSALILPFFFVNSEEDKVLAYKGGFSANVMAPLHVNDMAPLHVNDMGQFERELTMAKDIGIDGVSVDVWWGDVEQEDNQFHWTYYDTIFQKISDAGLKIVPIMSFHQCGGNVGDDYTSYLPAWVWHKYYGRTYNGIQLNWDDLKYKSSLGHASAEYLALWVDDLVKEEYMDFMNAFEEHYASYSASFMEINISCGPAGELRYPSYNAHDASSPYSGFPHAGYLQSYSNLAKRKFQDSIMMKYGNINKVNEAWGTQLTGSWQISPPTDGRDFFYGSSRAYLNMTYGRDFIEWYNQSLVNHGRRMLNYGMDAFDDSMKYVQLGIKIPGIHWQIYNEAYPRTAEICAGVINTDFSQANGYGYNPVLNMLQSFGNRALLHFTCLEMNNGSGDPTSEAKTLVGWVGDAAHDKNVEIKGENALSGGNDSDYFWRNIDDAITNHYYNGITILRMNDVVYGNSNNLYMELIHKHR